MEHFEFGEGERLTSVEVYTRTHGRKLWYEIGPPLLTRPSELKSSFEIHFQVP